MSVKSDSGVAQARKLKTGQGWCSESQLEEREDRTEVKPRLQTARARSLNTVMKVK